MIAIKTFLKYMLIGIGVIVIPLILLVFLFALFRGDIGLDDYHHLHSELQLLGLSAISLSLPLLILSIARWFYKKAQ